MAFFPCGAAFMLGLAVYDAGSVKCDPGEFFVPCLLNAYLCCIGATINRRKIRTVYGYEQNCMKDLAIHTFCMPCGVFQESREFKIAWENQVG